MKILVCGVGSIGERHINNLISLGYEEIILYRSSNSKLRSIKNNLQTFSDLSIALKEKPDIALITNPTSLHIDTAIECAKANCHLFIEKPLSNNLNKVDVLSNLVSEKKLVCMVGFMYRYHPLIKKIKSIIDGMSLGELIHIRSTWGEYLPDWHPWEDYRTSYAAKKNLGGGPFATLSHDIDLAIWFADSGIKKSINFENYNSDLEVDTSHGNDILIEFNNGVTANIHVDFFQKPYRKEYEVIFKGGRVKFDYYENKLEVFYQDGTKKTLTADNFDRNDMFIDEVKDFIYSVLNQKESPLSILESKKLIELINHN
jgi:predicted dehydrogenase